MTTPDNPDSLIDLADAALDSGDEEAAVARTSAWLAANRPRADLLHWHALLLRALERHDEALEALRQAARLAPADAAIARSLAQVSLEAGAKASKLFLDAIRLAPSRPDLRIGLNSARYAEGEGAAALEELGAMLAANPGWLEGHRQFAQLSAMTGQPDRAFDTIEAALARFPEAGALYLLALELLADGERHEAALQMADRAITRLGEAPQLILARAAALDELRRPEAAPMFARLGPPAEPGHALRLIRHQLRQGQIAEAVAAIEPWLSRPDAAPFWSCAALAWRLAQDPRADWLEAQNGLVGLVDLVPARIGVEELAATLRRLHAGSGRFLDQSVRGGTQTDGPLFARTDPAIRRARAVLVDAMADHLAGLPPPDSAHPQLSLRRDRPLRFAGAWSVRLVDAGHHASHHHPQGWFSAVLYVAVPDSLSGEEGRLVLGAPPADLGLPLQARQAIEPRPARLAIFPSTMWHATLPFSAGERLTIAFDLARPRTGVGA